MNNLRNAVSFSSQFNEADLHALLRNYQTKYGPSSAERFESIDGSLEEIREIFLPAHIAHIAGSDSGDQITQRTNWSGRSRSTTAARRRTTRR